MWQLGFQLGLQSAENFYSASYKTPRGRLLHKFELSKRLHV